jgi:hypothetical protein
MGDMAKKRKLKQGEESAIKGRLVLARKCGLLKMTASTSPTQHTTFKSSIIATIQHG